MNLFSLLQQSELSGKPVRAGLIGAGKFGSMFLAQAPFTSGLRVSAIADLNPGRARSACRAVGWDDNRIAATAFVEDGAELARRDDVDVVIEATGSPAAGIKHARAATAAGKHIVMVNVEADVLAGPLLAAEAQSAGVVYSLAYGDQPALVAEWSIGRGRRLPGRRRGQGHEISAGLSPCHPRRGLVALWPVARGGEGCRHEPANVQLLSRRHQIGHRNGGNRQCLLGLDAPEDGLLFPPCGVDDLPHVLRPREAGGVLERSGMVEVVSSLERDGRPVFRDLRWGVYVVIEAPSDYTAACFRQYGLKTDASGRYAAMYKPYHLIGLELNISVLSAALQARADRGAALFRAPTRWRSPSGHSKRAKRSMAKAASRSGAKCSPQQRALERARCPSGSHTASG